MKARWFRLKDPAVIQAVQLTEDADWEEIARWCGGELANLSVGDSGEYETVLYLNKHDDRVDRCTAWENCWIVRGATRATSLPVSTTSSWPFTSRCKAAVSL